MVLLIDSGSFLLGFECAGEREDEGQSEIRLADAMGDSFGPSSSRSL